MRRTAERIVKGGAQGWFAPTYRMMTDNFKELKNMLAPAISSASASTHRLEFRNGAHLDFWSLDNYDAARGRKYQWVVINEAAIARNLATYGVFAASERLLMEAVKAGGDRQALHEILREHSLAAWVAIQRGEPNPLAASLAADAQVGALMTPELAKTLLDAAHYVGDAPARARALAAKIRQQAEVQAG